MHAEEIHCVVLPCDLSITYVVSEAQATTQSEEKNRFFVLRKLVGFHSRSQKIDVESPRRSSMVRNISNIAPVQRVLFAPPMLYPQLTL